uniref:Uncharacterized protein n=1 Tax=Oryza rufipogon TaxID=4529 RepID=A0A0E0PV62_ORYRU
MIQDGQRARPARPSRWLLGRAQPCLGRAVPAHGLPLPPRHGPPAVGPCRAGPKAWPCCRPNVPVEGPKHGPSKNIASEGQH